MESLKKQTVYLPVKVEDGLPEIGKPVFTFNNIIEGKVQYPPKDDGENISTNRRTKDIPDKFEKWYDEHNFGSIYSKVHTWLKPQEAFVFTPEQLNGYTQSVIKQALKTGSDNAKLICGEDIIEDAYGDKVWVDEESITDTFEKTFKLFEV